MEKITKDIIDKIKKFSNKQKYSLDFILTNIRNMLNKKYEINKLDNVLEFCPLKFFIVSFIYNKFFQIKMRFPFL